MRHAMLTALAVTACASGPEVRPPALAAAETRQLAQDRAVSAELRSITARARRGEAAKVRQGYLEQSRSRPLDVMPRLYAAWAGAPSEDAWEEVARIAKMNVEEPWAWALSAAIYLQWRGFLDQANAEFDRALKARRGFVPARVGKADVLRKQGKLAEAKAAYEAVLSAAPDWQEALSGLGLTLAALQDGAAKAVLEKALAIDPEDLAATAALARLAVQAKDADQAIHLTAKMLESSPRDREARLSLARMKQEKQDLAGAAEQYEAAMALSQDLATAQALAGLYRELKRSDDEIRALEKVAQLSPRDAEPLLRIAELRKAEGDEGRAEKALRGAAERKPGDATLLLALARSAASRDDLIAGIEAYRLAKAEGAAEAAAELKELEAKALLAEPPLAGDVNAVYRQVFRRLQKGYRDRAKKGGAPGGKLRVRVAIAEDGKVTQVETLEDTVHDEILGALVYFSLKDAQYPKVKKSPTFEFVLGPAK
jgi:cytochrome c-type biogenesis protein CcmH/NrfG